MAKLPDGVFILEYWGLEEPSFIVGIYDSIAALNDDYLKITKQRNAADAYYAYCVLVNSYSPHGVVECSGVQCLHINNAGVFTL